MTGDGYPVRDAQRRAADAARSAVPSRSRTTAPYARTARSIGQLEIADFTSTAGLVQTGQQLLPCHRPGGPSRRTPAGTTVEQGKLEDSNTGSAEAAVRLVSVMRQFEMLQKAVALGAEMNRHAVRRSGQSRV